MANYINKDILCQAYIHIEPVPLNNEEIEGFKLEMEAFIGARGKFFIYDEVDTSIELRAGSLKVYATIVGAIYIAIGQYGSFRSGVNYLASDVKRLSDTIVSESLFLSRSRHGNIKHAEARLGVVGSLKKIVDEIDSIESMSGEVDPYKIAVRLGKLRKEIDRMLSKLNDPEDFPYIKENIKELVQSHIPINPKPTPKKPVTSEVKILYREERLNLLNSLVIDQT